MTTEKFGRFQIKGEIGLGGMGKVYLAHDPRRRRMVAVKVLLPEYLNDLGFRARFEQESQLVIALEHVNIVPVYEYGEHAGQPYIEMKYMPGGSLAERLAFGTLEPDMAAGLLERICSALDYAHRQGVIHRDLKPSNVLFDKSSQAYLTDFGIAMQTGLAWETAGTISGTPAYMSPEAVLREQLDSRSDIYSLGVIAFEMLCGRLPFEGDSPIVVALKQVYDPPPRLNALRGGLPPALEGVVMRALAKDAQERYPDAAAFADAFRHASQAGVESPDGGSLPTTSAAQSGTASQASKQPEPQPHPAGRHELALPEHKGSRNERVLPSAKSVLYVRLLLAMVMATCLGIWLAMTAASLAWKRVAAAEARIQVVYDEVGVAVINLSDRPQDITGLSFQGEAGSGVASPLFNAAQWEQWGLGPVGALAGGACYQLVNPSQTALKLNLGEAPAKPSACQSSQGWLLALDRGWRFWSSENGGEYFRVLYAGQPIKTCNIAQGICQFTLPGP